MTAKQKKRLLVVFCLSLGITLSAVLAITAFQDNLLYFLTPTQIKSGENIPEQSFRLGGMVQTDSFKRQQGIRVQFLVTDFNESVSVQFEGVLPDLFREGQGVVAKGSLNSKGIFIADEILAKHDENYIPPEVKEALEKQNSNEIK